MEGKGKNQNELNHHDSMEVDKEEREERRKDKSKENKEKKDRIFERMINFKNKLVRYCDLIEEERKIAEFKEGHFQESHRGDYIITARSKAKHCTSL